MDIIIFICYLLFVLFIGGIAYLRRKKQEGDFLNASRDHGKWLTALSASASSESGWVTLGLVGAGYSSGISCFWLLPGCIAGYLFNWMVLAPRIYKFANQQTLLSIPEILEMRYSDSSLSMRTMIRAISAILIIIFLAFYVGAQFVAGGKALEAMFGWNYNIGVIITAVVILSYTAWGGLRAISWTDVVQAMLMFGALVIVPILAFFKIYNAGESISLAIGGPDNASLDWLNGNSGFAALGFVIGWLGVGLGYPGQPHVLKRFLAASSDKAIRDGRWIALVWSQVVFTGAIVLGMMGRGLFQEISDPEQILPLAANELLPPVLSGLVIAAVFSAICSTADSQLLESSAALSYDLIPIIRQPKSPMRRLVKQEGLNRISIIIVGVMATYAATSSSKVIFWFVLYSWGALGSGIGTSLTMALLWRRCSAIGVILGLISGPVTVVLWKSVLGWSSFVYELVPAFVISMIFIVLGSLLFPCKENLLET